MAEVYLSFEISLIKPDRRDFGRAVELTPLMAFHVRVAVPLEHTLIANTEEIIQAQLEGGNAMPILTPEGLRFVTDALEKPYEVNVTPEDFATEFPVTQDNWSGGENEPELVGTGESVTEQTGGNQDETVEKDNWESEASLEAEAEALGDALETAEGWEQEVAEWEQTTAEDNGTVEDNPESETWSE